MALGALWVWVSYCVLSRSYPPVVAKRRHALLGGLHGISAAIVAGIFAGRRRIAERLPSLEVLDDVMYKASRLALLFHHCDSVGCIVGGRSLGWLLELGSQRNLARHRVVEPMLLAAHANDEGTAGHRRIVVALVGLAITTFAFLVSTCSFRTTQLRGTLI